MTKNTKPLRALLAPALGCLALVLATAGVAQAAPFDVTIYNASAQIFSPPIVVTHRAALDLVSVGETASSELAAVAEDADSEGYLAALQTLGGVRDVAIGDGVILPGESMTVRVDGNNSTFTVLGMMVTTNDTLYVARQRVKARASFFGSAYDAGSEANTLDCAHIPGPPCGNAGVRVTNGAEGKITISQGINRGRLRPFDWRDPVVKVSIRRASN